MSLPALRLSQSVAGRAVYIQIFPRPINIAESREIFKQVARYGELQYYKSQRYDVEPIYNGATVIFKDARAAEAFVQKSPIRFYMELEQEQKSSGSRALAEEVKPVHVQRVQTAACNDLPDAPPQQPILPFDEPEGTLPDTTRLYQITANHAAADPKIQVEMGHWHGFFSHSKGSVPFADLAQRVPVKGMAVLDWRQRKVPMRAIQAQRKSEEENPNAAPLSQYYAEYLAGKQKKERDSNEIPD